MFTLSIDVHISGAHYLRDYQGDCGNLHGHNWRVRVQVQSQDLDGIGMAIDFKTLKQISKRVIEPFDHTCFNEVEPFDQINPTAENMARYFYKEVGKQLPPHVRMDKVSLWETDKYRVDYAE